MLFNVLLFQRYLGAASVHFSGQAFRNPVKFEIERDTNNSAQEYYDELTGNYSKPVFRVGIFWESATGYSSN